MKRDIPLVTGNVYHLVTRSIAGYNIFNSPEEYSNFQDRLQYYQFNFHRKFSDFISLNRPNDLDNKSLIQQYSKDHEQFIQIVAYCLMPTHVHLLIKQLEDRGITISIGNLLNSYSRFFNTQHNRKGPLWEAKFKNVLIANDETLLHVSRYIHLNPVTAYIVDAPEKWKFSSYNEYLSKAKGIAEFHDLIPMKPSSYQAFVNDQISYQRELARLKSLTLE